MTCWEWRCWGDLDGFWKSRWVEEKPRVWETQTTYCCQFSSSLVMMMVALFFCVERLWDDIYGELDKVQRLSEEILVGYIYLGSCGILFTYFLSAFNQFLSYTCLLMIIWHIIFQKLKKTLLNMTYDLDISQENFLMHTTYTPRKYKISFNF